MRVEGNARGARTPRRRKRPGPRARQASARVQRRLAFDAALRLEPGDIRPTDFANQPIEANPAVRLVGRQGACAELSSPLGRLLNDEVARAVKGQEQTVAASLACEVQSDASLVRALPMNATPIDRIALLRSAQGRAEPINARVPAGALTRADVRIEARFDE